MKLIVDISEQDYAALKVLCANGMGNVSDRRILNGTPLQEGHGTYEDTVSRHDVLRTIDDRIEQIRRDKDKINKAYSHLSFAEGIYDGYCRLKCDLSVLSSVQSEPKTGHWINNQNGTFECDQCGCKHSNSRFCPDCGTKMQEVEE